MQLSGKLKGKFMYMVNEAWLGLSEEYISLGSGHSTYVILIVQGPIRRPTTHPTHHLGIYKQIEIHHV